jgi:AraC-like DNA-binding protein
MLPTLEKVETNVNHSFNVSHLKVEQLPSPLHFHPEIELLLVVKGTGTRFIGDSAERFTPGDLIMIGSNVPHVWYSDRQQPLMKAEEVSEVIYILFSKEAFGKQFWDLPESKSINRIIEYSQRGIKLAGKTRDDISLLMEKISVSVGFKRISILMDILEKIASSEEYKYLASQVYQGTTNQGDSDRLNKIYEFMVNNSYREITLDEAASVANLSTPAFCRYFKKRTNKTFIQFLNEIRVGHACRLLSDENYPVADICYMCGFNHISYFIKQFKNVTGNTPFNYRKNWHIAKK